MPIVQAANVRAVSVLGDSLGVSLRPFHLHQGTIQIGVDPCGGLRMYRFATTLRRANLAEGS
jgi:hypothetical protein